MVSWGQFGELVISSFSHFNSTVVPADHGGTHNHSHCKWGRNPSKWMQCHFQMPQKTVMTRTWLCHLTGSWKDNECSAENSTYKINWKSLVCSSRNNELPNGGSTKTSKKQLIPSSASLKTPTTRNLLGGVCGLVQISYTELDAAAIYAGILYLLGGSSVLRTTMKTAMSTEERKPTGTSAAAMACSNAIILRWLNWFHGCGKTK